MIKITLAEKLQIYSMIKKEIAAARKAGFPTVTLTFHESRADVVESYLTTRKISYKKVKSTWAVKSYTYTIAI